MDIKQYLYAWLGKQKLVPEYEFSSGGGPKHRQRFKCEVILAISWTGFVTVRKC